MYVVDHNLAPTDQGGIVRVNTTTGAQEVITQGNYLTDLFLGVQESPSTLLVDNGGGTLLRIDLIDRTQTVVASGLGHATSQPAVDPCGNIYVPDDGFGGPGEQAKRGSRLNNCDHAWVRARSARTSAPKWHPWCLQDTERYPAPASRFCAGANTRTAIKAA